MKKILLIVLIWISLIAPGVCDNYLFSPGKGARVDNRFPDITFSSGRSDLLIDEARIFVNGKEVTSRTLRTPAFLCYRPSSPLPPGKNTVEIRCPKKDGSGEKISWNFEVALQESTITVTHDADEPMVPHQVLTVTVKAEPGWRGHFDLGRLEKSIPLIEKEPGIYKGKYKVSLGDFLEKGRVKAVLIDDSGKRHVGFSKKPLTVDARFFKAKIIYPEPESVLGNSFEVRGRTAANTRVEVYGKLFFELSRGVDVVGKGSALGKPIAMNTFSDEKGYFKTRAIVPTPFINLRAKITVWGIDDEGNRSIYDQVTVYLKQSVGEKKEK